MKQTHRKHVEPQFKKKKKMEGRRGGERTHRTRDNLCSARALFGKWNTTPCHRRGRVTQHSHPRELGGQPNKLEKNGRSATFGGHSGPSSPSIEATRNILRTLTLPLCTTRTPVVRYDRATPIYVQQHCSYPGHLGCIPSGASLRWRPDSKITLPPTPRLGPRTLDNAHLGA